jgi:hypothetical protein
MFIAQTARNNDFALEERKGLFRKTNISLLLERRGSFEY